MAPRTPFRRASVAALWAALAVGLWPQTVAALDPSIPPARASHRAWTTEEGLPQDAVQAILQGPRGYLWLGTQEGLVRFDGVRFTTFSTHTTPALPANNVLALLVDPDDQTMWIGTRGGGLAHLSGNRIGVIDSTAGLAGPLVRALFKDSKHRLWIGMRGGGLQTLAPDGALSPPVPGLEGALVLDLCEAHDGTTWVATEGAGVCRVRDGRASCITTSDGLPSNVVWAVFEDHHHAMWVGTYGGGLVRFKDGASTLFTTHDGLTSNRVTSLLEDHDGNLWIGTDGGGLNRFSGGGFSAFTKHDGLTDDTVLTLYEDREGSLWIGTYGGLNRLKDTLFTVYAAEEGLTNTRVRTVMQDHRGRIWIGTSGGGLYFLAAGTIHQLTIADGLPAMDVFSLWEDRDGAVWVGTYGGGVSRFDGRRFTTWSTANGLPHDTVWAITGDHSGTVWVGTYGGGLARFDGHAFTTLTTADGLPSNLIRALLVDRTGTLWIGSSGGGLTSLRDGHFTTYGAAQGLTNSTVLALYEDGQGRLWVGTNGGGLELLEDGRLRAATTQQGLFDDVVFSILEDTRGNMWMSCNRGISRVAKDELLAVLQGAAPSVRAVAYGRADGMPTSECNGGSQPAGWRTADGELLFPTPRGLVSIDPRRLAVNPMPPPVYIERVVADGTEHSVAGPVTLPPGTRNLQIDYTALSFLAPEKVAFRYLLEGSDPVWTSAGRRRAAFFSHLPPGRYVFRVTACNNDGVWNPDGAELAIEVKPYFYQTTWFFALGAVGLVLAGFAAAWGRVLSHRHREQALAALVDERTAALRHVTEELAKANRQLEELSLSDALTSIANRRRFDQVLELLWVRTRRAGQPISLLMIDIDHFKAYNDRLGHLEGDRCLSMVARLIDDGVRRASDLAARYGGEEFAVVLDNVAEGGAWEVAEELRRRVQDAALPHPASPVAPVVTVSVGVATRVPPPGSLPAELVAAADRALYRAKEGGRNRSAA